MSLDRHTCYLIFLKGPFDQLNTVSAGGRSFAKTVLGRDRFDHFVWTGFS